MEKGMVNHASILLWKIPCTEGYSPKGLDWVNEHTRTACAEFLFDRSLTIRWRRKWQPTPVLLPGKSHGWKSLVGCSPWGRKELDMTKWLHLTLPYRDSDSDSHEASTPVSVWDSCNILEFLDMTWTLEWPGVYYGLFFCFVCTPLVGINKNKVKNWSGKKKFCGKYNCILKQFKYFC